ncbi:MAG: DUF4276 family protein [Bacteroidota bacterium]
MKCVNIIVEGSSEETFVKDVLAKHFADANVFLSARRITTGWDRREQKPAKGGLLKYSKFRNDVLRWIKSDRDRPNTWYTSMLDLYAFPTDSESPYIPEIREITDPYHRIEALERAIAADIDKPNFIPYVQLHEFEAFLLVEPDKLLEMYPDGQNGVNRLKKEINGIRPEEINESAQTAPSKRIIKYLPDYGGQKAQVGPMVAEAIGLTKLRQHCPHFSNWLRMLESL